MTSIIFLAIFLILISLVLGFIYFFSKGDEKNSLNLKEFATEVGILLTLVPSVFSFVYILFMAIDKKFVDALTANIYYNVNSDLASFVSVLAVTFPLYLILAWMKYKNLQKNPERKSIKGFEYGIYLTLFFTGLFLIGSLIAVIYNFLMGELTLAFTLQILVVAVVSLLLFAYSYFSLKRNEKDFGSFGKNLPHIATWGSVALVLISIIYSISIIGSPMEMRKRKFDNLRLQNISEIQNNILSFWQREYKLPESLENIKDDFQYNYLVLKDPKTKANYIYKVLEQSTMQKKTGEECRKFYPNRYVNISENNINCEIPTDAKFQICANFETIRAYDENGVEQNSYNTTAPMMKEASMAYPDSIGGKLDIGYYNEMDKNPKWNHPSGEYCFERKIEVAKYNSFR
jgi:uncharacterized membrane protein